MRTRRFYLLVAGLGLGAMLVAPSYGIAFPAQSNQQNGRHNNQQNNQANPQQLDQQKAREQYEQHVKEAEKAHKQQERQEKSAAFKSNVRKAIEHGRAR